MGRIGKIYLANRIAIVAAAVLSAAPAFAQGAVDSKPPQIAPGSLQLQAPVTTLNDASTQPTTHVLGTIPQNQTGDTDTMVPQPMPATSPVSTNSPSTASAPGLASSAPAVSADEPMQAKKAGDITYITGGVGDEERSTLDSVEKDYNLRVTSADKSGAFITDIHTVIRNSKGEVLLDTSAGPIFYAQLPPGSYAIEATGNGVTRKQNVTVGKGKASHLHFSF